MTYLTWGCDPLAAECQSCLDAICNACEAEYRCIPAGPEGICGDDEGCQAAGDPDCDRCDLERKPDCKNCGIILQVCLKCTGNATCEFRIT
jgi:hypothetical protein